MGKPQADPGMDCPFWRKDVSKVCHKCPLYLQIRGANPQTGQEQDEWGCAVALQVVATLNVGREAREGAAATESFRNEFVRMSMANILGPEEVKRLTNG